MIIPLTPNSRQSLKKYVKQNNPDIKATDNMFDSLFNKALKAGVDKGVFEQPKGPSGGTKLAKKTAAPKKDAAPKEKKAVAAPKEKKKEAAPKKAAAPKEKKAAAPKEKKEKEVAPKKAAPAPKEKKAAAPKPKKAAAPKKVRHPPCS